MSWFHLIPNLNVKCKATKLFKEIREHLCDLVAGNDFLNRIQKRAHPNKKRINSTTLKLRTVFIKRHQQEGEDPYGEAGGVLYI